MQNKSSPIIPQIINFCRFTFTQSHRAPTFLFHRYQDTLAHLLTRGSKRDSTGSHTLQCRLLSVLSLKCLRMCVGGSALRKVGKHSTQVELLLAKLRTLFSTSSLRQYVAQKGRIGRGSREEFLTQA